MGKRALKGMMILFPVILLASPIEYFTNSPVIHGIELAFNNPASIVVNVPEGSWYRYGLENISGSIHHPLDFRSATYHTITAAGHKTLKNKTLFSGTFSYRENREYNRPFRHNSTLNGLIPIYLGDSTLGHWNLSGIQGSLDIQKPLSENVMGGLNITYFVDEQIKQSFPKPGVKRNGFEIMPGIVYNNKNYTMSLAGSFFEFKEEIETVKYSLDQNLQPVFMLYRGFGNPIYYRGQTSYERLQTRWGFDISAGFETNPLAHSTFKGEIITEWSQGDAEDEGIDAIPQGEWTTQRVLWEVNAMMAKNKVISPTLFAEGNISISEATHPDFPITLYQGTISDFSVFAGFAMGEKKPVIAGIALDGFIMWREDSFIGRGLYAEQYFAGPKLHVNMNQTRPVTSNFYLLTLREISSESELKLIHEMPDDLSNMLLNDELWAMTAGNTLIETGTDICLHKFSGFDLQLDVTYTWLADMEDFQTVHAHRDRFLFKITIFPKK
ncbi:MAG: hypothetical protein PHE86_01465 [Candidatus Marinimicrobia bacterium]|nr:hypothetical protein [Candidatus Neomarinimicrobiota bacterium]MDD5582540.1 hypothetical protein [Candidatus Neomarinimicrobiota bacterium]